MSYTISASIMTAIADAIRTAAGSEITYTIDEMLEQLAELYFEEVES